MRKTIKITLFALLFITLTYSQNYLWPTNSSDKLSATFGEYRSGHFHAGIDIKTNNTVGYPCYAIESGYVSRIVTKPYGYGKSVYIHLNDGNIVVYAHLDGFAAKIDSLVKKEQKARGRYSITKYFRKNEIPVEKGEIVAFTGCTGTRHPHLHFEIRDGNHNPVNPLQFDGLKMTDVTPPIIEKIAIVPVAGESLIDQSPQNAVFRPVRIQSGRYRINEPIRVRGDFAIEISTHDIVRGLWNKYGPAKINLFIDDFLMFSQVSDKFSYSNTGLIVIDRNYQLMAEGEGRFIRMWKYDKKSLIPFHRSKNDGIIRPVQNEFNGRLEVYDFNGNKSEIAMTFLTEKIKAPKILAFSGDSLQFHVTLKRDTVEYIYSSLTAEWVTTAGITLSKATLENFQKTDSTYTFSLRKKESGILKITGRSVTTQKDLLSFFNPAKNSAAKEVDLQFFHNAKTFVTEVNFDEPPCGEPAIYLQSPKHFRKVKLLALSPVKYVTADNSMKNWKDVHTIEIRNHDTIIKREPVDFTMITPQSQGEISDGNMTLAFDKHFVYDTLMTGLQIDSNDNFSHHKLLSKVYTFSPQNQVLKSGAALTIPYADTLGDLSKVAIYAVGESRISYIGGEVDTAKKIISTNVGNFGTYALAADEIPPIIEGIYPADGLYYKAASVKKIRASIDDQLSGIAGEEGIVMKLDGEKVISEWHPIHHTLSYEPEKPLTKGSHTLCISVTDRAGNREKMSVSFNIVD